MSRAGGTVLLVAPFTAAMERELTGAGFEVVSVTSAFRARAAASGRTFAAYVAPNLAAPSLLALPTLRNVPGVCVASRWGWGTLPWPVVPFPRGAIGLYAADLGRDGALAEAVRTAIQGSGGTPGAEARVGEGLWRLGSVLQLVFILGILLKLAMIVTGRRTPGIEALTQGGFGAGLVLSEVGGCLGLGTRVRLSGWGWFGVVMLVLAVAGYFLPRLVLH